jgi:long-chain acyl-CoA synthetase
MSISQHIVAVTKAGSQSTAIDFNGQTITWAELGKGIDAFDTLLSKAGVNRHLAVGLLGRNRPAAVASFVAILGDGRELLLVNAQRPAALIADEISQLKLAVLVGETVDLTAPVVDAARSAGTGVVSVEIRSGALELAWISPVGGGPFRQRPAGTLIEIQTSGTTGAPKRIPVAEATLEASLRDGVRNAKGATGAVDLTPKASPTLMFGPLVHTSGTFNTLMSVFETRPIVLFEKFEPTRYLEVLRRYRPKFAALPPAAIRMLLESEATAEDFSSVKAVRAGTAPLPVDVQEMFETRFGVPVLTTYGATEFMGVVTSWTLEDHRIYGASKRGSVGRASKGVQVRIIDSDSGVECATGQRGLIEAKLDRIDKGRSWIRTSDLGTVDAEGFLYVVGRVDDAINRGGFKIMASKIADAVRRAPGVGDAVVVGRPDPRLGEIPIAVIEARSGEQVDEAGVRSYCKTQLAPYEVPAKVLVVPELPRTVSDKISKPGVTALLEQAGL